MRPNPPVMLVCARCQKHFERPCAHGPVPMYCSASCRQRAFEIRQMKVEALRMRRLLAIEKAAYNLLDAASAGKPTNEYWGRLIKALDRPSNGHAQRLHLVGSVEKGRKVK